MQGAMGEYSKEKFQKVLPLFINISQIYMFRGGWSANEDLQILFFVLNNGSKWAKLSRLMENRTEHCVKNRFFAILAKYCLIPIKKIKKHVDYRNTHLILEAIKYYQTLYEVDNSEEILNEEELNWEEFLKSPEETPIFYE